MPESNTKSVNHEEEIEAAKMRVDFLKHLTTLNTACIVGIAAFFDKFPHRLVVQCMALAMLGFYISIVMSLLQIMKDSATAAWQSVRVADASRPVSQFQLVLAVRAFMAAMVVFPGFVIVNVMLGGPTK